MNKSTPMRKVLFSAHPFFFSLLFLAFSTSVFSQKTWTGATDSNWNEGSNWSPTGVPGAADDIIIPDVANDPVATGIEINIASGITMTVEAGAVLTIDGQNAVADGIHNLGTVTNNGTIDISNTTDDAIQTQGMLTNGSGGGIIINGTTFGIYLTFSGSVSNSGTIKIGEVAGTTQWAIATATGVPFTNETCGLIHVFSDNYMWDFDNNFTNDGTIITNYTGTNANSKIETNNGIIYNLNGGTFTVATGNTPLTALPATYTWTGSTDSDWSKGCNWDSGIVPDGMQDVIIPNVANDPVATGIQIDIAVGSTMTVEAGATLTIDGENTSGDGIRNYGSIGNYGTIDISEINSNAIELYGTFNNHSSGTVKLNYGCNGIDVSNSGSVINDGRIEIGEFVPCVCAAIVVGNGTFNNNSCGLVHVFGDEPIYDFDSGAGFTNDGTIIANYTTPSTSPDLGISTNNGIVYNLGGGAFNVGGGTGTILTTLPTTNTWTGATDTNWFNSCNWDSGTRPLAEQEVVIPSGTPNSPAINDPGAVARKVTVDAGAQLIVFNNGDLTLNGQRAVNYCLHNFGFFGIDTEGILTVDSSNFDGIVNTGNGFLQNFGTIDVGGLSANGDIGTAGIWCNSGNSNFENYGEINIKGTGRTTATFGRGITNENSNFSNFGGTVNIDGTTSDGIYNIGSAVFNHSSGTLNIGLNGTIGIHGIFNSGTFQNNAEINIQQTGVDGIQNNGGTFNNDGGNINISNTSLSAIANLSSTAIFTNSNNGVIDLSMTGAGGNGIYTDNTFENITGGQIRVGNISNTGLFVANPTGAFNNGECSSFIGNTENIFVNTSAILTNTGYVGVNLINSSGTFDNTNGFVHDVVQTFNCAANGGTCLPVPLTHTQFISDNDNDGTTMCEGDVDDFNCSTFTTHLVSNTMDDGIGSLRWAIACAAPGDIIIFAPATDGQLIQLSSGQIVIDKDLTVIGNGMDVTIIDGSLDDANRFFQINSGHTGSFTDLTMQNGGGINFSGFSGCIDGFGNIKVLRCRFSGNRAGNGGVIDNLGQLNASNCIFDNNQSTSQSGAIQLSGGAGIITNCLFYNNQCGSWGGAVLNLNSGVLTLNNCTFAKNQGNDGGAIRNLGTLNMYNSILYDNPATNGPDLLNNGTVNALNNLIGDPTSSGITIGSNGNIMGDPFFVDAANNDFRLMGNSPAANMGDNHTLPSDDCDIDNDANTLETIDIDLNGNPRINNSTVDMGCFEQTSTFVTFRVDMNQQAVDPGGVFLAGNFMTEAGFLNDWESGIIQMTDPDVDGVYEIIIELFNVDAGQVFEFKYLNGPAGFEDVPAECGVNTTGFFNRFFSAPAATLTLPVSCYEQCGQCNSTCDDAAIISCGETVTGSTFFASTEPGLSCLTGLQFAGGVWYQLTGTGAVVTVTTDGSDYDTKLGVFKGGCGALECVVGNDDFSALLSKVSFGSEVSVDYYIYVTGFDSSVGNYQLNVSCGPACPATLTLDNSFSNLGGTFRAENSITLINADLFNGSNVILSAPEVNLPTDVDVFLGGSLETNSTGCVD